MPQLILLRFTNPAADGGEHGLAKLAKRAKYLLINGGHTNKSVSIRRSDSRIYVDSTPCVQPAADSPDHAHLQFMGKTFTLAEANAIRSEFNNLGATGGGAEWF